MTDDTTTNPIPEVEEGSPEVTPATPEQAAEEAAPAAETPADGEVAAA